jgi:FkbM family methyltransferase
VKFYSYVSALSFRQIGKLILIQLFRLRKNDVTIYEIIRSISNHGFKILKSGPRTFKIIDSTNKYILRKQTSDVLVFNQVIIQQEYKILVDLVNKFYKPSDIKCVIDAGANIGLTSLFLSSYFKSAKFIAIEPSIENFTALEETITNNKATQITPLQNALWFETSKVIISRSFRDGQEWSLKVVDDFNGGGDVQALTLSDIMEKMGIGFIDILKIDIEGAEGKLFQSKEFLKELGKIKFLAIELHEEVIDKIEVINLLQSIGFQLIYKGETLFGINLPFIRQQQSS